MRFNRILFVRRGHDGGSCYIEDHFSHLGKFDSIYHKVHDDLAQPDGIPCKVDRDVGGNMASQFKAFFDGPHGHDFADPLDKFRKIEADTFKNDLSSFYLRKIEDIVDDPQEILIVVLEELDNTSVVFYSGAFRPGVPPCRGWRSWAFGFRGSYWPGISSWHG